MRTGRRELCLMSSRGILQASGYDMLLLPLDLTLQHLELLRFVAVRDLLLSSMTTFQAKTSYVRIFNGLRCTGEDYTP